MLFDGESVMDVQANLEMFAAASVLGIGLILFAVSFIAYARLRNARALLVGLGFLVLAVKGAYLTSISWQTRGTEGWVMTMALFDLALALLLYFAIRKG